MSSSGAETPALRDSEPPSFPLFYFTTDSMRLGPHAGMTTGARATCCVPCTLQVTTEQKLNL